MARRVGPVKVRRYSLEFKLKAVKLSQLKGVEVQAVAVAADRRHALATVFVTGAASAELLQGAHVQRCTTDSWKRGSQRPRTAE